MLCFWNIDSIDLSFCWISCLYLSLLKPRRGPGQGNGPSRPENIDRRIAIQRPEIDRDVNFAKKTPSFIKMNTESINLTENPSDFVEPYFTKKNRTFSNRAVLREFCKKNLDFVKIIMKSINFMKNPLNFSVIDRYSVDAKFTK